MTIEKTGVELTAIDSATRVFNQVVAAAKNLGKTYDGLQATFSTLIAGFAVDQILEQTLQWEQASIRLNATLRATGNAVGLTRHELEEMADSLAQSTPFSDRDLRNAESNLLKFGNIHDQVFKEALKLSADYAAFTGDDVAGATQAIGRALVDPVSGLRGLQREFGNLTFSQKEYIAQLEAQGKVEEAQAAVLDIVRGKIGGVAEDMNTGLTKAVRDGQKAWDSWLIDVGHGLAIVAGELDRLGGGWGNMFRQMRGQPLQGLPPAQMSALGASSPAVAPLSWEEQMAKQAAEQAAIVAKGNESIDRQREAHAKAIPVLKQWSAQLSETTKLELADQLILSGAARTWPLLDQQKLRDIAITLDQRKALATVAEAESHGIVIAAQAVAAAARGPARARGHGSGSDGAGAPPAGDCPGLAARDADGPHRPAEAPRRRARLVDRHADGVQRLHRPCNERGRAGEYAVHGCFQEHGGRPSLIRDER